MFAKAVYKTIPHTKNSTFACSSAENEKATNKRKERKRSAPKNYDTLKCGTNLSAHPHWTRAAVIVAVVIIVILYLRSHNSGRVMFAREDETVTIRLDKFPCSHSYEKEMEKFPICITRKCGRFVTDKLIKPLEAQTLLHLAKILISKAGSKGGASVLDIHSGALSFGERFLNIYSNPKLRNLINKQQLAVYKIIKSKIKTEIARRFEISPDALHLTHPTFFSRFTNVSAKTLHDEYWHEHVDKDTYPSFHYTSLLYLNNFDKNFKGGEFVFVDRIGKNKTFMVMEPKEARLSAFTSGEENRHYVEKVTEGERYAVTISFTCDKQYAIPDPEIK